MVAMVHIVNTRFDLEPLHFTATRHDQKNGSVGDFFSFRRALLDLFEYFFVLVAGVEIFHQR